MGAPLYGQSFSLAERSNHGLNSPTYGGGEAGEDTRARGFLSYYEVSLNSIFYINFNKPVFFNLTSWEHIPIRVFDVRYVIKWSF